MNNYVMHLFGVYGYNHNLEYYVGSMVERNENISFLRVHAKYFFREKIKQFDESLIQFPSFSRKVHFDYITT